MARYRVTRRYSSAGYGPWQAGAEMDLSDAEARWLNSDSAGLLVPVVDAEPEPVAEPDPEADPEQASTDADGEDDDNSEDKPRRNRQHRPARARS